MGLAVDSLAALACKLWQQLLEAIHSKLTHGKEPLLFLPVDAWSLQHTSLRITLQLID